MKLAGLFSDHAVLQRGISVPVWGRARPKTRVRVTVGPATGESFSDGEGRFLVRLPPQPAGGPHALLAETADGTDRVRREDVCFGEVWVCSGQSNMQWTVNDTRIAPESPDLPGLRMFTVPNLAMPVRQDDVSAVWQVSSPTTAGAFSAVGFYLGRRLHRELGVPVGILNASWGGTRIEAWISRDELMQHPDTAREIERYELSTHSPSFWDLIGAIDPTDGAQRLKLDEVCFPADPGNSGQKNGWASPEFDDAAWPIMHLPGAWQERGHNYSAVFWFRRAVDLPADWAGKDLWLDIGAVDKTDITYFNGERVGATGTGFDQSVWDVPRHYRVPSRLVRRTGNVIAVRAYSFLYSGGMIGPAGEMAVRPADGPGSVPLAGEWRAHCEHNFGLIQPLLMRGPGFPNAPHTLFDSMILPLIPYAIRGAAWYQGESNTENPAPYGRRLKAMIRDWRRAWGQGDFPFLTVQLANYTAPQDFDPASPWAVLREGQLRSLSEPAAGLAVAIDIGEEMDIHPRNKADVGSRLAQWALARVHEKPVVPSGPLYSGMTIEGRRIRLRFEHVGGGLTARGGELKTFVIAGENKAFKPAAAWIEGSTVVVESPDVPEPQAVRYAWANNPVACNLYNSEGLPASPFRTDDW